MKHKKPIISAIVAMDKNRGIGLNDEIPWHLPQDLKRFKQLTYGHPVIMGRKTFESILRYLNKPLPGRTNIIVTRNKDFASNFDDVTVVNSIEHAIDAAIKIEPDEIFIIGGSQIFEATLPITSRLYLTLIDRSYDADTFFPDFSEFKKVIFEDSHTIDSSSDPSAIPFKWITLER